MAGPDAVVLTPAAARVLEVASRLFYERGIHAVGVDAIAEAAGVTKKTIYDRFRSKDNLITAYLERRDRRYREWITERVAAEPAADRPLVVFDALGAWLGAEGARGCAFVNAFGELADPAHPAHRIAREQKAWLRETFRELAAFAGHADAAVLADRLLLLHEGAVVLHSAGADPHATSAARATAAALLAAPG